MNNSLKESLNALREISSEIYHKYIPVIDDSTCDCFCHKTDFLSTIRRIFAKFLKLFGSAHDCCEHSEV